MKASGFRPRTISSVMPYIRWYSRLLGKDLLAWRSSWMRSTFNTSALATARLRSCSTFTPSFSRAPGTMVGGPHRVTSAPSLVRPQMFDLATRLWAMSPMMVTFRPRRSPRRWRMVMMSSSPWVGCSWAPSPALITEHSSTAAR